MPQVGRLLDREELREEGLSEESIGPEVTRCHLNTHLGAMLAPRVPAVETPQMEEAGEEAGAARKALVSEGQDAGAPTVAESLSRVDRQMVTGTADPTEVRGPGDTQTGRGAGAGALSDGTATAADNIMHPTSCIEHRSVSQHT